MFVLVYDTYTGNFLMTFPYILIYYTPVWFIPYISLSSPSPLLEMTSTVFKVPYLHIYRKYPNHIHPPPSTITLPLTGFVLHSCPLFFKCPFIAQ
jgi:hypothetical protein